MKVNIALDDLILPSNASIITFNAVAMYTNIDIDDSFARIKGFLSTIWDNFDCKATEEAR